MVNHLNFWGDLLDLLCGLSKTWWNNQILPAQQDWSWFSSRQWAMPRGSSALPQVPVSWRRVFWCRESHKISMEKQHILLWWENWKSWITLKLWKVIIVIIVTVLFGNIALTIWNISESPRWSSLVSYQRDMDRFNALFSSHKIKWCIVFSNVGDFHLELTDTLW